MSDSQPLCRTRAGRLRVHMLAAPASDVNHCQCTEQSVQQLTSSIAKCVVSGPYPRKAFEYFSCLQEGRGGRRCSGGCSGRHRRSHSIAATATAAPTPLRHRRSRRLRRSPRGTPSWQYPPLRCHGTAAAACRSTPCSTGWSCPCRPPAHAQGRGRLACKVGRSGGSMDADGGAQATPHEHSFRSLDGVSCSWPCRPPAVQQQHSATAAWAAFMGRLAEYQAGRHADKQAGASAMRQQGRNWRHPPAHPPAHTPGRRRAACGARPLPPTPQPQLPARLPSCRCRQGTAGRGTFDCKGAPATCCALWLCTEAAPRS